MKNADMSIYQLEQYEELETPLMDNVLIGQSLIMLSAS